MSRRDAHMSGVEGMDDAVAAVFDTYPEPVKSKLLFLRQLILQTAASIKGVGELQETIKWGQPSYLTVRPKTGTTIRIDQHGSDNETCAMYFHCQTTLVDTFREIHGGTFSYEGNRAIVFSPREEISVPELVDCISLALTYHSRKRQQT